MAAHRRAEKNGHSTSTQPMRDAAQQQAHEDALGDHRSVIMGGEQHQGEAPSLPVRDTVARSGRPHPGQVRWAALTCRDAAELWRGRLAGISVVGAADAPASSAAARRL